ncbi:MAG: ABC transporter substrate-binding protein [Lachnospiraceae bacterium]|nr:ABC transporter substrate-binding protein [Lachnospiraceae bacterium]
MKKRVLSLLLTTSVVAAMLAGCGSTSAEPATTTATESPAPTADTPDSTTTEAPAGEGAAEEGIDISEPVTLKWYLEGSNVTDDSAVLAEANAYLKEKLNGTLEPIWGTWGDFDDNATLSIQSSEDVDIYFTCSWTKNEYNAFSKKGYFLRLDDPENNLIEKYASDLWNLLPGVLTQGATINGADGYGVYAVPGYKDIATQNCWDVNVPLLEKYGYTIDDIKNADYFSFGEILETVKKGEGESFYPLLLEGAVLERMVDNSIIVTGDCTGNVLSYIIDPADPSKEGAYGNKLLSKYETEEFKKFVEQSREYYLAGYIDPAMGNAEQANDTRSAKQLSGEYLIGTQSYSLGYELQASQERGFEVAMVPVTPAEIDTTSSQGAMMAISTASKNPERAMMFLNLLNTDPYLMTLLNYGVEGTHYELVDGLVQFTDKRSDYQPWTNGMGNVTILTPTVDQGADFWDGFKNYYGNAVSIPIIGFSFDSTAVEAQAGALSNVCAQYTLALEAGTIDPETALPEFIQKLKDNGIDEYVAEANSQLQTFLDSKN